MKSAVAVPVTVKIRLGWNGEHLNYLEVARAAVDGGADAIFIHGRTRADRYKKSADWRAIGEAAAVLPVPVVGNGDVLFKHDIDAAMTTGVTGVMTARGALIKPWLFREADEGDLNPTAEDRVAIYRRYVALALEHWGAGEQAAERIRSFLLWHLGFWCRYVPRQPDGTYPAMQVRAAWTPVTPLEALLARSDQAAHDYIAACLLADQPLRPEDAPPTTDVPDIDDDAAEAGRPAGARTSR